VWSRKARGRGPRRSTDEARGEPISAPPFPSAALVLGDDDVAAQHVFVGVAHLDVAVLLHLGAADGEMGRWIYNPVRHTQSGCSESGRAPPKQPNGASLC